MKLISDERGLSQILMVLLAVLVLGGVGYAGYTVMNKDKDSVNSKAVSEAMKVSEKECLKEMDDKDLCKFFTNWGGLAKFEVISTSTEGGTTSKSTMKFDGKNTYMKSEGEFAMEVITMGDVTYTKAGETWWKQTSKKPTAETPTASKEDFKFDEPDKKTPEAEQTKYVKVGKEACGDLTCLKYKVVDPKNAETTEFIWFDDEDFLIRKSLSESKDGSKDESVYSYNNIKIDTPSPVKELGENQYIMPGQTEPATVPTAADFGIE